MEHISQHLEKITVPGRINLSEALKKSLTPEEQRILEVKYASPPFSKLSAVDLIAASMQLLLKIHVITGWSNPTDEKLQILLDQFQKKLVESYPNTNVDEVEYAFRTGGTTVKDWGKNMNLSLIDEVMIPYLESRKSVSRIEEQKKIEAPVQKESLTDQAMSDWLEEVATAVKNNVRVIEFVPEALYDWLDKTERYRISNVEKKMYLQSAAARRKGQLTEEYVKNGSIDNTKALADFMEQYEKGEFLGAEKERLKTLAKKMVVYDYLKEKE